MSGTTPSEPNHGARSLDALVLPRRLGVLFSQAKQELHLLNPTAAVIWSLLEEEAMNPRSLSRCKKVTGWTSNAAGNLFPRRSRNGAKDSLATPPA